MFPYSLASQKFILNIKQTLKPYHNDNDQCKTPNVYNMVSYLPTCHSCAKHILYHILLIVNIGQAYRTLAPGICQYLTHIRICQKLTTKIRFDKVEVDLKSKFHSIFMCSGCKMQAQKTCNAQQVVPLISYIVAVSILCSACAAFITKYAKEYFHIIRDIFRSK